MSKEKDLSPKSFGEIEKLFNQKLEEKLDAKFFQHFNGKIDDIIFAVNRNNDNLQLQMRNSPAPKTVDGKYKVMFLIHNISSFANVIEPLIKEAQTRPELDVIVASIPHCFPGELDILTEAEREKTPEGIEEDVHLYLNQKGIEHIRLNDKNSRDSLWTLKIINPAIIFKQSQWDADVPFGFNAYNLSWTRLCILPYSGVLITDVPGPDPENPALGGVDDQLYTRECWKFFTPNKYVKMELKNTPLQGKNCVETGHPILETIQNAKPFWPNNEKNIGKSKLKVILSLHHSLTDDWFNFGVFHYAYKQILKLIKDTPDVEYLLSMHPTLVSHLMAGHNKDISSAEFKTWLSDFENLPNTIIQNGEAYESLFQASDVLLTDGISWLAQYQIAGKEKGKPILYLERPDHCPFNRCGEVAIQGVQRIGCSKDNVEQAFENIKNELLDLSQGEISASIQKELQKQPKIVQDVFGKPGSAQRIVDELVKVAI
ncbi:MAG: hypothetical protein LBM13_03375 [Candidatus Ancillula sp.]|jgi:hypothetical protein|nr:hypothetical protein [Candidatus Ancillula sp.]